MYRVSIMGHTPEELKQNILDLAASYGETKTVRKKTVAAVEESEEEFEDVASPFATTAPADEDTEASDSAVDSEGLPWDARIHASSKAFNKDGTWRTRRGLDDKTLTQVRAELLGNVKVAPVAATPALPVETPTVAVAPTAAPVVAPVPAMPTMQSGHSLETFTAQFPLIIATLITEGKITQEYVNELKKYFGVAEIWMINDEQKGQVFASFVEYGFVKKVG
jgi:hypothetical protein